MPIGEITHRKVARITGQHGLAAARVRPQKNLVDLLNAFSLAHRHNPHIRLEIIGDGQQRQAIEDWITQHELTKVITLHGWQTEVAPIMLTWDAFALSSLWEGLPNVLLEAMAAGKPIIATLVGGTPEVVDNGVTGILVPPRDPEVLASTVLSLSEDSDLRASMGNAGRERVMDNFSLKQMVNRTENLYQELLIEKGLI